MRLSALSDSKSRQAAGREVKVLVCSLDIKFSQLIAEDAGIYFQFYPSTTVQANRSILEILADIKTGYDIVHLFGDVSPAGTIHDAAGHSLAGTTLIQICCDCNVRLLWIASNNNAQGYIQDFKAVGKPINLIMTLKRNGPWFSTFLRELLGRTSSGETLTAAWQSLSPRDPHDPRHRELPATIFAAGRMHDRYTASLP